jgi:UDP-N-acetylmuramoyl-tripeptide--D-alanyl-D-alanine ligase
MSELWNAAEAARATGGSNSASWAASGVSIDTRTLQPGDLFVALEGPNHDGHDHLAKAFAAGATAAMVHRDGNADGPLLKVSDTLAGLADLARHRRQELDGVARVIGVTGSVGKTGTKEILRQLLETQAPTHASAASHNNHWGVPLTIARAPRDSRYLIVEMGMNASGEIATLTRIARPHVAMITEVAAAHLAFFDSVDSIARAKAEIIEGIEPDGTVVLPGDNPHIDILASKAAAHAINVIRVGSERSSDWRIVEIEPGENGSRVEIDAAGHTIQFVIGVPGRHWARNAAAALAAIRASGGNVEKAASDLRTITLSGGRGQRQQLVIDSRRITLFDESYNANPASMSAALDSFSNVRSRKIAVLGDMLELGETSPELHAGLAARIIDAGVDQLFLVGPLMRSLADKIGNHIPCNCVGDAKSALEPLLSYLEDGDALLVKGSNGMKVYQIVDNLKTMAAAAKGESAATAKVERHAV